MTFCLHRQTTTPRRDECGSYIRCLCCGSRLHWEWPDRTRLLPPRLTAPIEGKRGIDLHQDHRDRKLPKWLKDCGIRDDD